MTQEFIGNIRLPIPELNEQKGIVSHLDRMTGKIDALIVEAESTIALLGERRTALITSAVTGMIDVRKLGQAKAEAA